MGLGKTLQTIALILVEAEEGLKKKSGPSLVIAPTSVVPNWQREIEKFAPGLKTLLWQGPNRFDQQDEIDDVDVMITSYALFVATKRCWRTRSSATSSSTKLSTSRTR